MPERDHYSELGVSRNASTEELGRAFRKLAAKYHPDRNPGDKQAEDKFKRIAEAYNVLNDPKSRAAYDQGGFEQVQADTGFRGFDSVQDIFGRFGDVFGDLFGERVRNASGPPRGEDYEIELPLAPDEASRGGRKTLQIDLPTACDACRGTGASGGAPSSCPGCGGRGYLSQRARQAGGFFSVSTPCPRCRGTGIDPGTACPQCGGRGAQNRPRVIEVTIPPRISAGAVLRLRGMGGPGNPPGDLRVRTRVAPTAPESSDGRDLKREVTVELLTAVLGGTVEVPLTQGTAEMKIPPGTQPGQHFRLRGQGLSDNQGRRGDLLVTVQVRIPTQLSDEERRLLESLRSSQSRPRATG